MSTRLHLTRAQFTERERPVAALPGFEVSAFRYDSGVEALRLRTDRAELVVLPFRGQQVWRARFDGRELAMRAMFDQPSESTDYLRTYGAFLIHCGLLGLGAPGPTDSHPLHGELPNAPFQQAWLDVDEAAGTIAVGGSYRHTLAFTADYRATVSTTLPRDGTLLDVSLDVENLKRSPMELMYLAHANFRPVDGSRLAYTAPYTAEAVRVRQSIPSHIRPAAGYPELLARLARSPAEHHVLEAGLAYDPEVVFNVDMRADADGWAHALQLHPGGTADLVSHRPDQAPRNVRWICRTPDQDALGLSFPATSGTEGATAEKALGHFAAVAAGATWRVDMRLGALDATQAADMARHVDRVMERQ